MTEQNFSPEQGAAYKEGWNRATDPAFQPERLPGGVSYMEMGWDDRLTAISEGRDPGPLDQAPHRRFIGV